MRTLNTKELKAVAGGVNPHLIAVNPGGQSNKSTEKNPNTTVIKTTGKWN
jgi:bacteriocin-like protein